MLSCEFCEMSTNTSFQNISVRLLLILFVACFLYFPLSNIFATKKVASCEKSWLVENRLYLRTTAEQARLNSQKQPSRCVLRKRCSENMQPIYRRIRMPKFDFNKAATLLESHFGMGVLLSICCIFSEHFFLRTPLNDCFWCHSMHTVTQSMLIWMKMIRINQT